MVIEDELGAVLGARLHEELADMQAPPGLAATVHRRRTRHRVAYGALAVPVVAAGIALAVGLGGSPAGSGSPVGRHSTAADPRLQTVAYISAQSQKALGTVDQYVIHESSTQNGQPKTQSWSDGATPRTLVVWEPVANPPHAYLMTADGGRITILDVDYQAHTWSGQTTPVGEKQPEQGFGVSFGDPAQLRDQLRDGTLTLVGSENLQGRQAQHLRLNPQQQLAGQVGMDLWVDAQSYLPLKMTGHKLNSTIVVAYEWLPRTAANLARVQLTPPAGFTQGEPTPTPPSAGPDASPKG